MSRDTKKWDFDDTFTTKMREEGKKEFLNLYNKIINELETEFEVNKELYHERQTKIMGITNNQLAALVGLLTKKGILK